MDEITNENSGMQDVSVNLGVPDLNNLAGWATFTAIIDIIVGALSCLGFFLIVPLAYGILQIMAGVKLLNAADDMKRYMANNEYQKVADTFMNLNKYFKFTGISIILKIAAGILIVILYGVLIAVFAPYLRDIIDNSGYKAF